MNPECDKRPNQLAARLLAVATRIVVYGSLATVAAIVLMRYAQPRLDSRVAGDGGSESGAPRQTAPATSADWPHLRGFACDGHGGAEIPLVDHWPAEGPPVLWTREFGTGYSALIAVEDRVYTQVQDLYGQYVACLEAETGEQRWRTHYAPPYNALEQYPGPRSTPTWYAGRVYFAGPEGTVGCLDAENGAIVWNRNVLEDFSDREIRFGYASSPWVEDGRVIVSVGGKDASVVALDADDGSLLWKSGDEPASYCSPMPITFDGERQFVVFQRNAMYGIAPADGRILWETRIAPDYNPHAAAPLYEEPYLMVMLAFHKGSALYRLDKTESGHAAEFQWRRYRRMSHDVASSVLVDGCVYGFDLRDPQARIQRPSHGKFTCMDFRTGEIRWTIEEPDRSTETADHATETPDDSIKAPGHSSVIAADGKLILLNDSGELILLRATPEKYDELARASVFGDERCWITPTLGSGFVYLRSPTRIACVYLGDEAKLGEQQRARAVRTSQIEKASPWNLHFLLGGEREYPAAAPSREELVTWYLASMASMAAAALAALLGAVTLRWSRRELAVPVSRRLFWSATLLLALVATPLGNGFSDTFVFTWPLAVFAVHQATLAAIMRDRKLAAATGGGRVDLEPSAPWAGSAMVLALHTTCVGYYLLCKHLGMDLQWIYLAGLLPAELLALPAARKQAQRTHPIAEILWAAVAFSLYFWAASGLGVAWQWWSTGGAYQ